MVVESLITKLIKAGAVQKRQNELAFTNSFGRYLVACLGNYPVKSASVKTWREMLGKYDPSLETLSIEEIHVVLSLLYYNLNKTRTSLIDT